MTNTEVIKYSAITVVVGAVAYFVFRSAQGAAQAATASAQAVGADIGEAKTFGEAFTDLVSHPFRVTYANYLGLNATDTITYINTGVLPTAHPDDNGSANNDQALQSIINDNT